MLSITMNKSTCISTSCLDICIYVFVAGSIRNFPMMAIRMFTHHTPEQIFIHAANLLDVLYTEWRSTILSIKKDEERKMACPVQGVATVLNSLLNQDSFSYMVWIASA